MGQMGKTLLYVHVFSFLYLCDITVAFLDKNQFKEHLLCFLLNHIYWVL